VDKKTEEWLRVVYESARRLAALVHDLLDVSRIEQGRMKIEKKELDICQEIEAVIAEFKPMATSKGLGLVFEGMIATAPKGPRNDKKEGQALRPARQRFAAGDAGGQAQGKTFEKVLVLADSARLRQVLANLISNSLKYTKKGRVVISIGLSDKGLETRGLSPKPQALSPRFVVVTVAECSPRTWG